MKYTVVWQKNAEDRLAELWLAATPQGRAEIRSAADLIDKRLGDDPVFYSVPRSKYYRMSIVEPLGVTFEIREGDRVVDVFAVDEVSSAE